MRSFSTILSFGLAITLGVVAVANDAHASSSKKKPAVEVRAHAAQSKASKVVKKPVRASAPIKSRSASARTSGSRSNGAARHVASSGVQPAKLSYGQIYGLHSTQDELDLSSSVALVVDQDTHEVLLSKNSHAVLPIASLTKLMTALVVTEAGQSLDDLITITQDDIDTEKGSHSRLRVGTQLSRGEMLHLALMSSENRAANALGRHYPGGLSAFVVAMNRKAKELGMRDSRYVEPTGLSSKNQSSAQDLAVLVNAAYQHQIIRELSTSPGYEVDVGGTRQLHYKNTNGLVRLPQWEIGLQKTGYISEAGRCLVMQARLAGRKLIMVFLDSAGKYSRIADAERVRKWVEQTPRFHSTASTY